MFERLLKSQTDNTFIQILRYAFTGSIAFLIDIYALYFLTEFFHIYYLGSVALAYIIGIFANYLLCTIWVFGKRISDKFWFDFGVFILTGLIGLGLVEFLMYFFTETLYLHYMMSKLIATMFVSLWIFYTRKIMLDS